jgi:hypothetical protein
MSAKTPKEIQGNQRALAVFRSEMATRQENPNESSGLSRGAAADREPRRSHPNAKRLY